MLPPSAVVEQCRRQLGLQSNLTRLTRSRSMSSSVPVVETTVRLIRHAREQRAALTYITQRMRAIIVTRKLVAWLLGKHLDTHLLISAAYCTISGTELSKNLAAPHQ
jgi:hypothetical protein